MAGVAALELWVGGDRVEISATSHPDRPAASARWQWLPSITGETIILARAFDTLGRSSQSAPLRVIVRAGTPDSARLDSLVAPGTGHGLDAISLVSDLQPVLAPGLAIPQIAVSVTDCQVTATASGGGTATAGFAFSALPPTASGFVALPPLAPSPDGKATATFGALSGLNFVTVSSYSTEALAPSAIVPVVVPGDCSGDGWQGDARIEDNKLVVTGSADRAYLYLKVGGGSWQRVPAATGSFVEQVAGVFDFDGLLPALGVADAQLEAWGWSGGNLVELGVGTYDAPGEAMYYGKYSAGADPLAGFGTSLDIQLWKAGGEFAENLTRDSSVDRPGPGAQSAVKTFKWSTVVPGVTHLVWQILPYPVGDTTTINPPFLIDTGVMTVSGASSGYFTLDLSPYIQKSAAGVSSTTTWLQNQVIAQLTNPTGSGGLTTGGTTNVLLNPNGIFKPTATPGSGASDPMFTVMDNPALLMPPVNALYVRVIPFVGTTPIANPSNSVSFDIVEPWELDLDLSPPPDYSGAYKMTAAFHPPTASDEAYTKCVRVVKGGKELSPGPANMIYGIYGGYDWSNGTTHCQPPPSDDDGWSPFDAFESFADWVGEVWDYVSAAYSWVQDKVVDIVLTFVPCEQIANKVTDSGKEVCQGIAKTALQAVMVSFGLPPEIPDWAQTISAAKGDLRAYILANARTFPAVATACDAASAAHAGDSDFPTCDQVVDKAIDTTVEYLVDERSSAAASSAGVVVPDGITVEPDPRGMPQPPHFTVTVTRTSEPMAAAVACSVTASMLSTVANWKWVEYQWANGQPSTVSKTGTVTGYPYMSVGQAIAPLSTGQSASYELWLTKRIVWFEPDGFNDHYAEQWALWNQSAGANHAWVLTQPGAQLTALVSSNCSLPIIFDTTLTSQVWE